MNSTIPTRAILEANGIKVAVAMPLERNINYFSFLTFITIMQKGWGFFGEPYMRTDAARNEFAKDLLESDFTHVLMLDDDHLHLPDIVERLARWVLDDPKKRVVGGMNFRRSAPFEPCVYLYENGELAAPLHWEQGIGACDAIGFGCVLIAKSVFEELEYPYFAYTYGDTGSQSEDIFFSLKCAEKDITIWCDTTTTSPHLGYELIDESKFRSFLEEAKIEAAKHPVVEVPHVEVAKRPDLIIPRMRTKVE